MFKYLISLLTENCLVLSMLEGIFLLLSVVTGVCTEVVRLQNIFVCQKIFLCVKLKYDLFEETGVVAGLTSLIPHSTSYPDLDRQLLKKIFFGKYFIKLEIFPNI